VADLSLIRCIIRIAGYETKNEPNHVKIRSIYAETAVWAAEAVRF
jgi:hypothetical protein